MQSAQWMAWSDLCHKCDTIHLCVLVIAFGSPGCGGSSGSLQYGQISPKLTHGLRDTGPALPDETQHCERVAASAAVGSQWVNDASRLAAGTKFPKRSINE